MRRSARRARSWVRSASASDPAARSQPNGPPPPSRVAAGFFMGAVRCAPGRADRATSRAALHYPSGVLLRHVAASCAYAGTIREIVHCALQHSRCGLLRDHAARRGQALPATMRYPAARLTRWRGLLPAKREAALSRGTLLVDAGIVLPAHHGRTRGNRIAMAAHEATGAGDLAHFGLGKGGGNARRLDP